MSVLVISVGRGLRLYARKTGLGARTSCLHGGAGRETNIDKFMFVVFVLLHLCPLIIHSKKWQRATSKLHVELVCLTCSSVRLNLGAVYY